MTVMLSHVIKTKGSPLVKSLDTTMDVVFTALTHDSFNKGIFAKNYASLPTKGRP